MAYREERMCRQDGGMAVRKLDSIPLCASHRLLRMALRAPDVRIRTSKKDDACGRVAALRNAPNIRQLGRAERDLVGFRNAERPV